MRQMIKETTLGITFRDYNQAVEYLQKLDDQGIDANIRKIGNEYIVKLTGKTKDLTCPFCGETGFDNIGLKSHIKHGDCKIFESLEDIDRIF
jgi:hypothetical protein